MERRPKWRAIAVAVVGAIMAGMFTLAGAGAASAVPGDYTIDLTAPATIGLHQPFNYTANLRFESVSTQNPATGVVLTTTLPDGLQFDSVPTGPGQVVASATYDSVTRLLTLTLNDVSSPVVSLAYSVTQVNSELKYDGMPLTTTMDGTGGPSGPVSSASVTTTVQGDNDYSANKWYSTVVGSDGRTVTYRFNVYTTHANTGTTFTSWAQELTDTFPAGAQFVSASPAFDGGSWDTSTWPTATWSRADSYGASSATLDPSNQMIWLTVYYPDSVAGWEEGQRPDINTVDLDTEDANGVSHAGSPASTHAGPFGPTVVVPGVTAVKLQNEAVSAGEISAHVIVAGAYQGPIGQADADELVITDSGVAGGPSADWFEHLDVQLLTIDFSPNLLSAAVPYLFEYQVDGSATWQTYTGYSVASGTTADRLELTVQNVGSTGWVQGTDVLDLPVGSTLSGWRVTLAPGSETVGVGSEVTVDFRGQPVFRPISDGVQNSTAPAATAPGTVTNTATLTAGALSTQASSSFTPTDSVYLTTQIDVPGSLSVGGTGTYRAGIINQNPSETYTDSKMSVVLPCGIQYDPSQAINAVQPNTVGIANTPAIGAGVTVDATQRVPDANGCDQQVVEFTFASIPPMRAPGEAKSRNAEDIGWRYDIPVTVLAQAFNPLGPPATADSYVHSEDPRFLSVADGGTAASTVPMTGSPGFFGSDIYGFDAARAVIGFSRDTTGVNAAGALLISKLSSASASGPWALSSPVSTEAYWQIHVADVLPNPVSDTVFFDALPSIAVGDDFDSVLSGPVTGAPASATVEYSIDATTASNGTWTTDPTDAIAFRVTIPTMTTGESFDLIVPTTVLGTTSYGQTNTNEVDAAATYDGAPITFASNEAAVTIAAAPALTVIKTTNGVDVPTAADAVVVAEGSAMQWTYVVENTGNTALDGVTVDDLGGLVSGTASAVPVTPPAGFDGSLNPGETATFTATGIAIVGQYHNTATATGDPVDDAGVAIAGATSPSATDESWYTGQSVALGVVKQAGPTDVGPWAETVEVDSGDSVFWNVTVTNTGTADLQDVVVADPLAGFAPQTIALLAAGDSVTIVIEQANVTTALTNVATATVTVNGTDTTASDDASATIAPAPALTVVKKTNGVDVATAADAVLVAEGSTVQWSYDLENTGNTVLDDVTVADAGGPVGGASSAVTVTAPAGFDGTLDPGETVTFTATGTAIAGPYENTATATGTPVDANGVALAGVVAPTATDGSWYTGGTVALGLVKQVGPSGSGPWSETVEVESGDSVYWSVTVTNTGDIDLQDVVVSDPQAGFTPRTIPMLAAGDSETIIIEQTDVTADITNVATATVDSNGSTLTASDDASATVAPFVPAPELTVVKTTNGVDVETAAEAVLVPEASVVQWTYEVENTGNTVLDSVTVTDAGGAVGATASAVAVAAPAGFDGTLDPGETVTFTATGTAIAGPYENTATATGTPIDANGAVFAGVSAPTAADQSWYTGGSVSLDLVKQVGASDSGPWTETLEIESGDSVFWSVTVTNTGDIDLQDVVVSDPQAGFTPQTIPILAAGDSETIIIEQTDVTADITNVASASATLDGSAVGVSDDASVSVAPPVVEPPVVEPPVVEPPVVTPPVDKPDAPGLAATGAAVLWTVGFAMALLLSGAVLFIARRRHHSFDRG